MTSTLASWSNRTIAFLLFLATFIIFAASPVITSCDSAWTVPTALSLLHEGNPDLNEFPEFLASHNPNAVEEIDGRIYSIFPVAVSVALLPFVAASEWALPRLFMSMPALEDLMRKQASGFMTLPDGSLSTLDVYPAVEFAAAVTYAALGVALFFLLARQRLALRPALILTALFAFGTSMWSTSSRALWQHGPAILMLLGALWGIHHPVRRRPFIAGILMASAYLIRPTFAFPAAAIGFFLLVNDRRALAGYALAALLPLGAFAAWNVHIHGQPFPPYFAPNRLVFSDRTLVSLAGNLVSPARGLLVYSPFLAFAFIPLIAALRPSRWRELDFALALAVPAHFAVLALFYHWWGGYSVGPRLTADLLPVMFWFLIPWFDPGAPPVLSDRRWKVLLFASAAAWSVLVHGRAATSYAVYFWNDRPVSVDRSPERLWDWSDPPFLRTRIPPPAEPGDIHP